MQTLPFTEEAGEVLVSAAAEARHLRHESVHPEHILIGLLRNHEGSVAGILRSLGSSVSELVQRLQDTVSPGSSEDATDSMMFSLQGQQALMLARAAARELGHQDVDTTHLLLGLIKQEKGISAQVLLESGINEEKVRSEIRRLLD